jgi:hypothetical protein
LCVVIFVLCRPEKGEERGWAVAGESTPEPRRTTKEKETKPTVKRYLMGLSGERGKAKKKKTSLTNLRYYYTYLDKLFKRKLQNGLIKISLIVVPAIFHSFLKI